jgi:hypothetical protein
MVKETFGKTTFVTLPYIPALTKGLERIFRSLDLNVAYTAGPSLQNHPKDKVNSNEKLLAKYGQRSMFY